ncbi:MAG: PRC-barrel domain-containing protein [Desulfobacterales bacterium]
MTKSLGSLLTAFAFVLFVSAAGFAGSGADPSMKGKSHSMMESGKTGAFFHQSHRVSKLIGTEVENSKGEKLGRINDLITAEDGRLNYLVVARGGVMGLGSELVPIPIGAVPARLSDDGKCIIEIEKTTFDNAPSFASNEWPDVSSQEWQSEARGYFGSEGRMPPAAMPGEEAGESEGSTY